MAQEVDGAAGFVMRAAGGLPEHVPDVERFRLAPRYDFTQPPHAGDLHYEQFGWELTPQRWRSLAAAALKELE